MRNQDEVDESFSENRELKPNRPLTMEGSTQSYSLAETELPDFISTSASTQGSKLESAGTNENESDNGSCSEGVDTGNALAFARKDEEKSSVGSTSECAGSTTGSLNSMRLAQRLSSNVPEKLEEVSMSDRGSSSSRSDCLWSFAPAVSSRMHHPVPLSPITLLTWALVHPVNSTFRTVHTPSLPPPCEYAEVCTPRFQTSAASSLANRECTLSE